jgi:hypothetical protein
MRTLGSSVLHRRDQTTNQFFKLFHQNIRGLRGKTNELLYHLYQDLPNLLCFSEPHLNHSEPDLINIENCSLGAKCCRQKLQRGGVSIFIRSHLQFTTLNLDKYCVDQDIEVALIQDLHQRCLTLTLVALIDITEHEGKFGRGEETSRNMRGRMEEGKNVVLYCARCGAGCWI